MLRIIAAKKYFVLAFAIDLRAQIIAHAVAHHHLTRKLGGLFEVIAGACCNVIAEELLRSSPAQHNCQLIEHGISRIEHFVVIG